MSDATGRPALEIAVESAVGAKTARLSGADRVELCQALQLGGVGPSVGQIESALAESIPVHVLIRPRPGDFVYAPEEISGMAVDAADAVSRGARGVVVGALTAAGRLDLETVRRLAGAARDAGVAEITVHRAIDRAADPVREAAELAGLGVDRVLTSGGRSTVGEGLASGMLSRMLDAAGPVPVMAGGGLTIADLEGLLDLRVAAVHLSAARPGRLSADGPASRSETHRVTDGDLVSTFRARLD